MAVNKGACNEPYEAGVDGVGDVGDIHNDGGIPIFDRSPENE
jgi:hypothetical protein